LENGSNQYSNAFLQKESARTFNLNQSPWNLCATQQEFYQLYEDSDLRKEANFLVGPQLDYGGSALIDYYSNEKQWVSYSPMIKSLTNRGLCDGARPFKYRYKQFQQYGENDVPIVRLGTIYLIRAESKARLSGNWNDALHDVNVLRTRSKMPIYQTITSDEFLKERGRETFMEMVRRSDLIRFGKYTDERWEKPVSQKFKEIFPIPQSAIISSQGKLKQNPGY
jgi:hypothetical protein